VVVVVLKGVQVVLVVVFKGLIRAYKMYTQQ
jgi:hypothetical protein